jgi:hypothetical protein
MTVRFEVTHPRLGNWGVTLPAYKWGFSAATEYLTRAHNTTPTGSHSRATLNIQRVLMSLTFREADAVLDSLRTLTVFAHRYVRDVRFYPDYEASPGAYYRLDWATDVTFNRVLDNLQEVEVLIVHQSPGMV